MASVTVNRPDLFPPGTTVALYPAGGGAPGSGVDRKPAGAVLAAASASGTATTASGSNQLTAVTGSAWAVGMIVTGTGIPSGTRITAVSGTTLTLSKAATAAGTAVAITGGDQVVADDGSLSFCNVVADTTYVAYALVGGQHRSLRVRSGDSLAALGRGTGVGSTTAASASVTAAVAAAGAFLVGQRVSGPGIPAGARIVAISGGTLTLTEKATATAAGVALEAHEGTSWRARARARRTALGTA